LNGLKTTILLAALLTLTGCQKKQGAEAETQTETAISEFSEKYSVVCGNDKYIVIEHNTYSFNGGAHGLEKNTYITVDLTEKKILGVNDFMNPVPDSLLDKAIKSKYEGINSYLRENIWPPDGVILCGKNSKNTELIWNRYTITPYVYGEISVEIQDDVIRQYLTDKGKALSGL